MSLFEQLRSLATEQRNRRSSRIDSLDIDGILRIINAEDRRVAGAVAGELPHIAKAVKIIVQTLKSGGRLFYVGAGTSGRLGVLDATECPPTFGTDPSMIQGIIAGGPRALVRSQEGAEDKSPEGARSVRAKRIGRGDVVCGIAASARTPFVTGAIREAKARGARTIYLITNPRSVLSSPELADVRKCVDVAICPDVGAEVIMGSTRMKSGTAQKLVLNMLTTAAMIRLGKVYGNMMIDLKMNSRKLEERARRTVMIATGVNYREADASLRKAGFHVKSAIVMVKAGVTAREARKRLQRSNGFVRAAIKQKKQKR